MSPNSLKHLALIMDGNGRWASERGKPRIFGHKEGVVTAKKIISYVAHAKIPYLTLFVLSAENSSRPQKELNNLMKLFRNALIEQSSFLKKYNIRLHILGNIHSFPEDIKNTLDKLIKGTKSHTGLNLILALNYGGQQEITEGMKEFMHRVEAGLISSKAFNQDTLSSFLPSSRFPAPDLILRTGGYRRLSNFYLWSSIYSEICFEETLWPDFNTDILQKEIEKFFTVKRNFGTIKSEELR